MRAYRSQGTSVKINLGVNRLPEVTGMPAGLQPYHGGIMEFGPFIAEMDRAQAQARVGELGSDPHTEVCIPTVHDSSLAPDGHHVLTIDINSQPYELADGHWDETKESVADEAVARLEGYRGATGQRPAPAPPERRRRPMSAGREIVVASTAGGEYDPDPLDAEQVIEGSPETSDRALGEWGDGTLTGIWRCEPGRFSDVEVDESFVVLEGRATIEHQGSAYEVGPGDVCILAAGAETIWTVHEPLLKVYVLQPDSS